MPFDASIPLRGTVLTLPDLLGQQMRMQDMIAQQQRMRLEEQHGALYAAQAQRAMAQAAKDEAAQQAQARMIEQIAAENPQLANLLRIAPQEAIKRLYPTPVALGRSLVDPSSGRVLATDEAWTQEQQAAGERRREEAAQRLDAMKQMQADRFENQRAMANLAASLRPPQQPHVVQIDDPNNPGTPVYVTAAQAIGKKAAASAAGTKVPAEITRMALGMTNAEKTLARFEELVKDFDPRNPADQINTKKRGQIDTISSEMTGQGKEALALGALTGPDVELMTKLASSPTSPRGMFLGKEGIEAQIKELKGVFANRRATLSARYPGVFSEAPGNPTSNESQSGWSIKRK